MRVLIINSVCGIRSTGRICTDLAAEFERQGHDVKIAYGRFDVPEQYRKYAVRIGTEFGVKINALKARVFDNEGLNAVRATKRFLKCANEYNPDLLWIHNIHGYYLNYELLFAWIKTRPQMKVKWTLHDCWTITGHCTHFSLCGCDKWEVGCYDCEQKREYPGSLLLDQSRTNYKQKMDSFTGVKELEIITPSQWLANLVHQSYLKSYPVTVVHNTIDTTVFKPTPSDFRHSYGLEDKKIILGVASSWSERKGLNDFIKLRDMLDEEYAIVLVGLNKQQVSKMPSGIIGIERTNSREQLAEIYTAADMFVNPTYEDNYPTVNLEAEACGTRVVTYATGGCAETIVRQDSVVIKADVQSLFATINSYFS